jgi:hypothetical protein
VRNRLSTVAAAAVLYVGSSGLSTRLPKVPDCGDAGVRTAAQITAAPLVIRPTAILGENKIRPHGSLATRQEIFFS